MPMVQQSTCCIVIGTTHRKHSLFKKNCTQVVALQTKHSFATLSHSEQGIICAYLSGFKYIKVFQKDLKYIVRQYIRRL